MTVLHSAVVCVVVLCLALGMYAVLSHVAIRMLERKRPYSATPGAPATAGRRRAGDSAA